MTPLAQPPRSSPSGAPRGKRSSQRAATRECRRGSRRAIITVSSSASARPICGRCSSRQLSHASPSITLNVYAHLFDAAEHAERARDEMQERFGGMLAVGGGTAVVPLREAC